MIGMIENWFNYVQVFYIDYIDYPLFLFTIHIMSNSYYDRMIQAFYIYFYT